MRREEITSSIFLILLSCLIYGCANGQLPEPAAWPWEHAKDYANHQTGDYLSFRGNVANFGDPPKPVKPINPESLQPGKDDGSAAPDTPAKIHSSQVEAKGGTISDSHDVKAKREYEFAVRDVKVAPPSYLPSETFRSVHEITAYNHSSSPVSVIVRFDLSSQNIAADKALPHFGVVPPNSEQVLVRVGPKVKGQSYSFNYSYSWNIGDYTARHNCPEHYRFPFAKDVEAFATVSADTNTSPFTRYAVIFSMPVKTPVRAARKGVVVRVRNDNVDILHDDSTIASYRHLEKIADDITIGKMVSAGVILGIVGRTADRKEGYIQLTVWRPDLLSTTSLNTVSETTGFDYVSFPMEFCHNDAGDCHVIEKDQMISSNKVVGSKKQAKRKAKVQK
ncbi:peptidoglycan DD-metalloendopeptidase family protein [Geotalea sp. SG265]|uniref:peptidoglycan DD-metalloendopeptidase family protein n=1 Tax=Geotalea sp. SG265 TaxID=2922867 RepID=UPI001FAFDC0F|nr:peptidoglycan DD-metalloendopeptidase family protein [Geotalea sp. SG265]